MTCKQATQKDFLWISPELVACYLGLRIDDETFPDHACLRPLPWIVVFHGGFCGLFLRLCLGIWWILRITLLTSLSVTPPSSTVIFGTSVNVKQRPNCRIGLLQWLAAVNALNLLSSLDGQHPLGWVGVETSNPLSLAMMSNMVGG
jgi:hypothetical protein